MGIRRYPGLSTSCGRVSHIIPLRSLIVDHTPSELSRRIKAQPPPAAMRPTSQCPLRRPPWRRPGPTRPRHEWITLVRRCHGLKFLSGGEVGPACAGKTIEDLPDFTLDSGSCRLCGFSTPRLFSERATINCHFASYPALVAAALVGCRGGAATSKRLIWTCK